MAGNRFGTWKKRTAAVFMAVCLLGAMPGAVWAADTADGLESSISDSETKKQELEQKNAELSQALEEAKQNAEDQEALHQAYQDKIDVLDQQIEEAYAQVSQLDEEINDLQSQISNREGSIEKNTELLQERIRAIYMAGETSTLDIILGAEDFSDFLDKASLLQTVTSHDVTLIETIQQQLSEIQEEKDEIEAKRTEAADKKTELDGQQEELTRLLEENQVILEELYGVQQEAQDKVDENDAELQAIEAQISAYYTPQQPAGGQSQSQTPNYSGGAFVWPAPGFYLLTSEWNEDRGSYNHGAIDIAGGGIYGTPVVAAADGTVVFSSAGGWGGGYGTYLMIDHGGGVSTLYAHMSGLAVSQGATVSAGQVIGYVGSTGDSSGPHLHFEVREYGTKVNPMNYF